MKLIRLTIKYFKGLLNFTLDAHGANVAIFGDNATYKTTIADSYYWLMYDKDSQNKTDFAIKTLDAEGKVIPGIDHEVETVFFVRGREITFRKVYFEKWTKHRGSTTSTFEGNTTDYFIDGVPVKKNEYVTRIKLIADEKIFKLVTSPTYFNEQLSWQERRQILLEICGDISDEDVIASDKALAALPSILNGHTLEDCRKIIAARRTKINDELKKIPIRIDEVQKGLPDLTGLAVDKITAEIDQLKGQIKTKEQELSRIESGNEVTEKRNQIRKIDGDLISLKNEIQGQISEKIYAKRQELQQIQHQQFDCQSEAQGKKDTLKISQQRVSSGETLMADLRDRWHNENAKQFIFEQNDTCPTCGQSLPTAQLAAAREKALSAFNLDKAETLEAINTRGKETKDKVEVLKVEIQTLNDEISRANDKVAEYTQNAHELEIIIENMMKDADVYKEDPAYVSKLGEKQSLEDQIKQLQQDNTEAVGAVKKDIEQLGGTLLNLQTSLSKVDQQEKGKQRIEELSAQERNLAAEYEKLEGELYLTEQFIRTKVNLLEEKINSKFQLVKWKLFDVQVNGGLIECCEALVNSNGSFVPYSSGLNNAARINGGLDIINTLSEHYKFDAPIFVDNAEAVTRLISTRGQQIKLVVSEPDKELRIVVEGDQGKLFKEAI